MMYNLPEAILLSYTKLDTRYIEGELYYMHILGTLGIFPLKLLITFP